MPTYQPRRFANPETLKQITPRFLVQLLEPYRSFLEGRKFEWPAAPERKQINYEALAKILITPGKDTPDDLADALHHIHHLAVDDAMKDLLDDARRAKVSIEGSEDAPPTPADVAVQLWLADHRIVEERYAKRSAKRPRSFRRFQTDQSIPQKVKFSDAVQERLEAHLDEWFDANHRGRGTRVFPSKRRDGTWFLVRHGDPYRCEGKMDDEQHAVVLYQPEKFDVVIYDPRVGDLRINAASDKEVALYREAFGLCVFGNADFFPKEEGYTLAPLRDLGEESLDCEGVTGISSAVWTEMTIRHGGRYQEIEIRRASNLFASYAERNASLPQHGEMISARFKVKFSDSKMERSVVIKPPNIAQYTRDDDGVRVDHWLRANGFFKTDTDELEPPEPAEVLVGD